MSTFCVACNQLTQAINQLQAQRAIGAADQATLQRAVQACRQCFQSSGVGRYGQIADALDQLLLQSRALVNCLEWRSLLNDTVKLINSTAQGDDPRAAVQQRLSKSIADQLAEGFLSEQGSCGDARQTERAQQVAAFLQTLHDPRGGGASLGLPSAPTTSPLVLPLDPTRDPLWLPSVPRTIAGPSPRVKTAVALQSQ